MRPMSNLDRSAKESYSELEAAAMLGISVARLYELLDKYVFTAGNRRPESIDFTASDLLLLRYWNSDAKATPPAKILPMPKR